MDDKSIPVSRVSSIISLDSEPTHSTNQHRISTQRSQSEWENKYISQICEALALDDTNDEAHIIAKHLLIDGRQALLCFRDHIIPVDFDTQMKNDGSSVLLQTLKSYFQDLWQHIPFEWFDEFMHAQQLDENDYQYQCLLKRAAEYGSKFIKNCPVFSAVLQLVFEFDDDTIADGKMFDQVWNSFAMYGCDTALKESAQYIAPTVMEKYINAPNSPLFLALREYFREPLVSLFSKSKIVNRRNLLEIALNALAKSGWTAGLEDSTVNALIVPIHYKVLITNLKEYLDQQGLSQLVTSTPGDCATVSQQPTISTSSSQNGSHVDLNGTALNSKSSILEVDTLFYVPPQTISITQPPSTLEHVNNTEPSSFVQFPMPELDRPSPTHQLANNTSDLSITSSTENNTEYHWIQQCVKADQKIDLSTLVQAGELLYIEQRLNDIVSRIVNDYQHSKNFSKFIQDCLVPIMYLLKRHQNLTDFFEYLSYNYSQALASPLLAIPDVNMRLITHVLLMSSDLSVSRMIMSLLSKRNPVPFIEPSLDDQSSSPSFVLDIIHVWDYSLPTLLSFGIGPCKGKSSLLNTLFMSSFDHTARSIFFQQTIDIDFGYNFLPRRTANIADTHGEMTKPLLSKIHNLFDGFIIQIEGLFLNENVNLLFAMLDLLSNHKFRAIIVRDVDSQRHEQCRKFLHAKGSDHLKGVHIIILPNICDRNNNQNKFHIRSLRDTMLERSPKRPTYERDYLRGEILQLFEPDTKQHLINMTKMITPLKNNLIHASEGNGDILKYFPVYDKFVQLSAVRQQLARVSFYEATNNEQVYTIRQATFKLETELQNMGKARSGPIFDLFISLLRSPETLVTLDLLASELRQERNRIVPIGQLAQQVSIEKNLSLEVLWRNAIVCCPYQPDETRKLIFTKYSEYMTAGYPFEIIDGDNFHFASTFLTETLSVFENQKILVVSIIGPQNSGKSTLLNYMFGTLFDVRDGRCTRGIYGSFVKSNSKDFDYIMLIDTEGLMGTERGEKEFDRRLVLFCLAVSHLVIVNMIGEINDILKDMLTLCADTLKLIGVSRVSKPKVHFVLNQKADLNIENNRVAIEKIMSDMVKLDLSDMIDIRLETFHTLPSAFKKDRAVNDTRLPSVIRTEPDFIERVQSLCGVIIESGVQSMSSSQEQFVDPLQWLRFSVAIFDTLQKFSDLTYFRDINERRQDDEVREHIRTGLARFFSAENKERMTEETANHTEQEIYDLLHAKEAKIHEDFLQELENTLKLLKTSDTIRQRSRQFLKAQITEMFIAVRTSAIMVTERARMKLLVRDGEGDLKRLIEDTIRAGTTMNEIMAREKFEFMFNDIVMRIIQKFDHFERLRQAINFIYTNYNIYEHDCLSDYQHLFNEGHVDWLKILNESQMSIEDAKEPIGCRFTYAAYQHSCVEEQPFNPDTSNPYSAKIIHSLVYLNKNGLGTMFTDYCTRQSHSRSSSSNREINNHPKGLIHRGMNAVKSVFSGHGHADSNVPTEDFQQEIRRKIIREKPTRVASDLVSDSMTLLRASNYFHCLTKRIMDIIHQRQIDTNLIQRVVGSLHTLIKDINLELSPFNLALSRHLKSALHSCAVCLLTKAYYNEQAIHFCQTVETLQTRKKDLCDYFVSMVVPNISYDANCAVNLANQIKEQIVKDLALEGQRLINIEVRKHEHVNRRWVQQRCDGKLFAEDISWHLDYIENPDKIIRQFFDSMWHDILQDINHTLTEQKMRYARTLIDFFQCIDNMMNAIKTRGAAATFVDLMFQTDDENALSVNENLTNKKRCMAMVFYFYLSGLDIPKTTTAYDTAYTLKAEGFDIFSTLAKHSSPSAELIATTKTMLPVYDSISIGNLTAFLEMLLNEKNRLIAQFNQYPANFDTLDTQDTYARLLDKVRGCPEKCPCCRRPCDADHTLVKSKPGSEENQHCCALGHALRAMSGYRYEKTDEASLAMCEHIKPDQIIIVGPLRKRWSELKKDHADWNFDPIMSVDELNLLHGKFLTVWAKVGKEICRKYKMNFVLNNTIQPVEHQSFHYILLLDGSGSMAGTPWNDLLSGVREFIRLRLSAGSNDRVTIIVFSSNATIAHFNKPMNDPDLMTINFLGRDTNFAETFTTLHSAISRANQQAASSLNIPLVATTATAKTSSTNVPLRYIVIFMSDGQAQFPQRELTKLQSEHSNVIEKFWTVALGDTAMDVLKKINQAMRGHFLDIQDSSQLLDAYTAMAEVAPPR